MRTPRNNSSATGSMSPAGALARVKDTLTGLGMTPKLALSGGGTDGNVFILNGIEAVVVGAAMHDAHTVRESVKISELEQGAKFCRALIELT